MQKINILFLSILSFFKINKLEKNFCFYSENFFYKNYYYEFFKKILNEHSQTYILTSDIKEYENIKKDTNNILFIGKGFWKILILNLINARYLFTTMPGIGFNIKKSKFCKYYVYFFHALASTHVIYKNNSFDNYDLILTNGNYQKNELEIHFKQSNIKNKNIFNSGYFFLDFLQKNNDHNNNDHILFAPSWNYNSENLFNNFGEIIVNTLLISNFKVIFRPHPEIIKRSRNIFNNFVKKFIHNKNFYLDLDPSNLKSMKESKILITDNSSIGMEFGLAFQKPTLYINYEKKIHNTNYQSINIEALEETYKNKFGIVIKTFEIKNLPKICKETKLLEAKEIFDFMDSNLSNIGNSVNVAKDFIFNHQKNNFTTKI